MLILNNEFVQERDNCNVKNGRTKYIGKNNRRIFIVGMIKLFEEEGILFVLEI